MHLVCLYSCIDFKDVKVFILFIYLFVCSISEITPESVPGETSPSPRSGLF